MKVIGFSSNLDRDPKLNFTKQCVEMAKELEFVPVVSHEIAKKMKDVSLGVDSVYKDSDVIVVLGGDGTVLSASQQAAMYDIPLLGINIGFLGYLTDVEFSHAKGAFIRLKNNEYIIEKRMMLSLERWFNGKLDSEHIALNDVFVSKSNPTKMVDVSVHINDEYFETYRADGVIISTPTGSTAYNLSAGGPILKPDAEMLTITPVCTHDLHSRPCVLPSKDIITIEATDRNQSPVEVACDGKLHGKVRDNEVLKIKQSTYFTSIVRTEYVGFYERLRQKIGKQSK